MCLFVCVAVFRRCKLSYLVFLSPPRIAASLFFLPGPSKLHCSRASTALQTRRSTTSSWPFPAFSIHFSRTPRRFRAAPVGFIGHYKSVKPGQCSRSLSRASTATVFVPLVPARRSFFRRSILPVALMQPRVQALPSLCMEAGLSSVRFGPFSHARLSPSLSLSLVLSLLLS